jgi:mRNA interferase HigB
VRRYRSLSNTSKINSKSNWLFPLTAPTALAYIPLRSRRGFTPIFGKSNWHNLVDVQTIYPKAEAVGNFTVFNIKGNRYRLIVDILYSSQRLYIKYVLTHAEYSKDDWKNDPYF